VFVVHSVINQAVSNDIFLDSADNGSAPDSDNRPEQKALAVSAAAIDHDENETKGQMVQRHKRVRIASDFDDPVACRDAAAFKSVLSRNTVLQEMKIHKEAMKKLGKKRKVCSG
jgi:hypothetical protein